MKATHILFMFGTMCLSGCADGINAACTEIGCSDGLSLTVSFTGGFSLGAYEISVDPGSGEIEECDFEYIESSSDCDGATQCVANASCSGIWSVPDGTVTLNLGGNPDDVVVSVKLDDEDVKVVSLSPEYTEFQPNGEGCEPVCSQATETVTVD
jgi:hypothetical protein